MVKQLFVEHVGRDGRRVLFGAGAQAAKTERKVGKMARNGAADVVFRVRVEVSASNH